MPNSPDGLKAAVDGLAAAGVYISAHNADPGRTGANQSSTGRVATTWAAADVTVVGEATRLGTQVAVPMPAGSSASHYGVWSAAAGGTFIGGGPLGATDTFGNAGTESITPQLRATG